jgi:membrane-bound metal-dependent hydrolase YbcI (DUF457 family)
MGPGVLFKACLRASFSLMVFGWAQFIMDLQPLLVMITGRGHLHGFSHTYIGAALLAVLSAISGKYLAEFALKLIGLVAYIPISWTVAFISATIGTFSHVLLDSIMHHDLRPFWPISSHNGLLGLLSMPTLHWSCIGTGIVGAMLYCLFGGRPMRRNQ